ncbi:MAG TPA: hypothetical protein VF288_07650 [Mycobacteriales bacterium]
MSAPASSASLRVFVPLSTLPPGERRRWERYVAAGRALDRAGLVAAERAAALVAIVKPTLDVDQEHALVEVVDGVTYICPARTQLRVWEAAAAFRGGLPDIVADAFVPAALADEATDQLAGWREVSPGLVPHVRSACWTVPLSWFLLFDPAEEIRRAGELRFVAGLDVCRRRATRAAAVLAATLPQVAMLADLQEIDRWLDQFHRMGRVELDYGGLAALLGEALAEETSVADLAGGLDALARGDGAGAAAAYERVARRWRDLQLRENAS